MQINFGVSDTPKSLAGRILDSTPFSNARGCIFISITASVTPNTIASKSIS
jgi:hypothetical protein